MRPFEHLPHRHPFLMLDTASVIEAGKQAEGTRLLTSGDPILLPDGTLPQAYVIEAMAQISGIASGRHGTSLFAGISGLSFAGSASAGDVLRGASRLERNIGGLFIFTARAAVKGSIIAEGGLLLHFDENA